MLYVSGYTPEPQLVEGVEPASAFRAKPFTGHALLARVRSTLDAR